MAVTPTYDIRVAWDAAASNALTIGESTFGEGDVLASALYADFGGTHDDVSSFVQGFDVAVGRTDVLSGMPMGECTVRLTDVDGRFNPKNAASPLAGQLLAMRPVRIQASYGGTTHGVFRGFVRTIEHDPVAKVSTIQAGDLFLWLSRVFPTIASTATTTGGAINLLLDAVGLTEPGMRLVSRTAGDAITFAADGSKSALSLIEDLLVGERGVFFCDGWGVATYVDRHTLQATRASVASITDQAVTLIPSVDVERIRNRASVSVEGGTPQVASDPDSQATYGWADIPSVSSEYIGSDAQAAALANYLVALHRTFGNSVRGLHLLNSSPANVVHMLGVGVQDRVTVTDAALGTSDYVVEGVRLVLDGVTLSWDAVLRDCEALSFFVVGASRFDGSDVLGF